MPLITIEREALPAPFTGTRPKVRKELLECTLTELKAAYACAMIEKNEYHTESVFQPLVNEEMILITDRLKYLRQYHKQPK